MRLDTLTAPETFGPWAPGLPPAERLARLRALRAFAQCFAGAKHPFTRALAAAETDDSGEADRRAWAELAAIPSRDRRNILSCLARLQADTPRSPTA